MLPAPRCSTCSRTHMGLLDGQDHQPGPLCLWPSRPGLASPPFPRPLKPHGLLWGADRFGGTPGGSIEHQSALKAVDQLKTLKVQVAFVGLGHPGRCRAMGNEKDPDFRLAGATGALHASALECCALKRGHFPQPADREESGYGGARPQLPGLVSRCVERCGAGTQPSRDGAPRLRPTPLELFFFWESVNFHESPQTLSESVFLKYKHIQYIHHLKYHFLNGRKRSLAASVER